MLIGSQLVGDEPMKNCSKYSNDQHLSGVGTKQRTRVIDSLDLENFLHPK